MNNSLLNELLFVNRVFFKGTTTERIFLVLFAVFISSVDLQADEIGTLDTLFKFPGSNH